MEQRLDRFDEEIPWYPFISADKCKGCRTCFKFCRSGALVFNKTRNKARLKYPLRCRVECRICARFCPVRAISFPDQSLFVETYVKARPDVWHTLPHAVRRQDMPPALHPPPRFVFRSNRAPLV